MNYYNENDPRTAEWIRQLILAKCIPNGFVDQRSIVEVQPDDLKGFTQCHFFAGIGGWPLALQLAGWPEDEPVWTGSCPCQPISGAGLRKGHADERHLWPAFYSLIAERKPATVLGEQVASKDGREWFSGVRADLEGMGYACGASDLCAAGVGAPHIRQRLYWVAMDDAGGPHVSRPEQERKGFCRIAGPAQPFDNHTGIYQRIQARPNPEFTQRINGIPRPVDIVRGYGNAIVPPLATEFIKAVMEINYEIEHLPES
jgi:DNA (cytosine-5)-methyltransferase 1